METIIVILIVAVAAAYLIRRIFKRGITGVSGCDCTSCSPDKNECTNNLPSNRNRE